MSASPGNSAPAEATVAPLPTPYTRFADSTLWSSQREYYERKGMAAWAQAQVPHYVTCNPSMAHAFVTMVLGLWRDIKRQGLSTDQPLYIIELGAGSGRFAYHFLVQFFEAFDTLRSAGDKVVYVMTDFAAGTVEQWQQDTRHKLKPYIDQGRLDFAIFDAEADTSLQLLHHNITLAPHTLVLPPVVIANYVFSALRQDLFFLDKDRIYEGWLSLEESTNAHTGNGDQADEDADHPFRSLRLAYQKRRVEKLTHPDPAWCQLIEHYAQILPPCALLVPTSAMGALERLRNLHGGNMLLLSADRGTHKPEALARQQEPQIARHGSFSLPVNYHAMAAIMRTQGARCWASPHDDNLAILAARWPAARNMGSDAPQPWPETALAAQQALQQYSPNDFYQIKRALESDTEHLSAEHMLAYLRLSHWDIKIFSLFLPYLQDELAGLSLAAQGEWLKALAQIWKLHLPIGEDYDLAFDMAILAAQMNRWSMAIRLFQHSLADEAQGDNRCSTCFNLAIAHWQMADHAQAETYLAKALALAPEEASAEEDEAAAPEIEAPATDGELKSAAGEQADEDEYEVGDGGDDYEDEDDGEDEVTPPPSIAQQLSRLQAWQVQCSRMLGAQSIHRPVVSPANDAAERREVFATLLGVHHAQALYRWQRDPDLAARVGVERLRSVGHAQEWIEQQHRGDKTLLAVLHPDFGMIGVAAFECAAQAHAEGGSRSARFYYWVGQEFQHQGYGAQALSLLWQFAQHHGVQHLFSTVDTGNLASQRALAKQGGACLPFGFTGGAAGHRFYHYGAPASEACLYATLARMLTEINADTRLAPWAADEALQEVLAR